MVTGARGQQQSKLSYTPACGIRTPVQLYRTIRMHRSSYPLGHDDSMLIMDPPDLLMLLLGTTNTGHRPR